MGQVFSKRISIGAGNQFLGTELKAFAPKPDQILKVKGVFIQKGSESATWQVKKTVNYTAPNSGTAPVSPVKSHIVFQSVDGSGVPGANTDTDVAITGADAESLVLLKGEQIQITSTGLTAAAVAEVMYEVVDNLPTRAANAPLVTR